MVVTDNPGIQLQSRSPVREDVPMEEQVARANRFVSLVVGHTENVRPQKHSSKLRQCRLAELRVLHLEGLLRKALVLLEESLEQLNDPENPQPQG